MADTRLSCKIVRSVRHYVADLHVVCPHWRTLAGKKTAKQILRSCLFFFVLRTRFFYNLLNNVTNFSLALSEEKYNCIT